MWSNSIILENNVQSWQKFRKLCEGKGRSLCGAIPSLVSLSEERVGGFEVDDTEMIITFITFNDHTLSYGRLIKVAASKCSKLYC